MTKVKLWGGRFKKGLDEDARKFSYSLMVDYRLAPFDIQVNLAHAKGLHKAGYLNSDELSKLETFFAKLLEDYTKNPESFLSEDEDIHSYIERVTTEALGDLGKKIHTGKSRNDQVATDFRLYMMNQTSTALELIEELLKTIWTLAKEHTDVIIPGFTHLQTAQPVLFSHHLLAHFERFSRDRGRLIQVLQSTDVCPLGSGALAGNNYDIDRAFVGSELGFSSLTRNSMDAVSDRDFAVEFCFAASLCMTHLSQWCEELVLWSSPLVNFIEIGDDFTTGSSIMPQKKNPDMAELIRGKSGRVLGHLVAIQHLLKSLPLSYNRDLQEDKEMLFDASDTLNACLKVFGKMLPTITLNKETIEKSLRRGHVLATEVADYLVKKGMPFREAHETVGKLVMLAEENEKDIEELTFDEISKTFPSIDPDIIDVFDIKKAIENKESLGGTSTENVQAQLNSIQEIFKW